MRKIKFRAWDKHHKKWYALDGTDSFAVFSDETMHLMQYTGLKDKNGVEIYEGDILKHTGPYFHFGSHHLLLVEWENGDCLNRAGFKFSKITPGLLPIWDNYNVEVIGNLWENPELLKSQEQK